MTREIIQIATEHELVLFIEYNIQTETGGKNKGKQKSLLTL